ASPMVALMGGGGGLSNAPLMDVQAVADPVNNAILVFGKPNDIESVRVSVIEEYDKSLKGRLEFATVKVQKAIPSELLAFIQPFLDQMAGGQADSRNQRGGSGGGQHPAIVLANDNAKTLEVRGSKGQIHDIETLVAQFDNPEMVQSN